MYFRELVLAAILLNLGRSVPAEDFQTNVVSGVSVDLTGFDYDVGVSGSFNYFEINGGGSQTNEDGVVGDRSTANHNFVVIKGANSVWENGGDLYVGNTGSVNQVTIQNGGQIINNSGTIGYDTPATSNRVVVTDANSLWSNTQTLTVGGSGACNQLIVTNGGRVNNPAGTIGLNPSATNNMATVTGANTLWSNTGVLRVGDSGAGSQLTVDTGGRVANTDGQIGRASTSTNNAVLVTGANSLWNNSGSLIVGVSGGGNQVTIQDGGVVSNVVGHLGFNSSGGTNTVIVTGANALWFSRDKLVIGNNGGSNQLSITNSGTVRGTNVVVGAGSAGNRVDVLGGQLIVTNTSSKATLRILGGTVTLNGGTVTVDQLVVTNVAVGPSIRTNMFVLTSGTLNTKGTAVTNGLPFTVGDGTNAATLNLLSGTHSFVSGLTISSNSLLTGVGVVNANVTNSGTINPGNPVGQLSVIGNLALQAGSVLNFDLGGYTQGSQYDTIFVSNTNTLAGQVSISFINGFGSTITNGSTFVLLTASPLTGAFANAPNGSRLQTTDGLADFLVTYFPSAFVLSDSHDLRDSVGDGIPNWWRHQYFGGNGMTTNAQSCATCDADGTGQNNLFKYVAGLNPKDPTSVFVLQIVPVVGQPTQKNLIFNPVASGRTYTVEFTTDLTSDSYGSLTSYSGPQTNVNQVTVTDMDATPPAKFYHVHISLP